MFQYTEQGYTVLENFTQAQANDWTEHTIYLPYTGPFKLEFEGIRGSSYEGDIALDDIELDDCAVSNLCGREDHDCTSPTCVPTERVMLDGCRTENLTRTENLAWTEDITNPNLTLTLT